MKIESWVHNLTLDMIQGERYKTIAEAIGVENFIKLATIVGGETIYIPKADTFFRPVRDSLILKEFNGYNHVELARKYDLSERWIRNLCGDGFSKRQLSIFDIT